jgi:hypothetical protein
MHRSHLVLITLCCIGVASAAEVTPPEAAKPDAPAPAAAPEPAVSPAPAATPAPAKPAAHRAVVTDFQLAGAAHADLARVLSDAAAKGAGGSPELSVISQGEILALLGLDRTRQMLGCTDEQGCGGEIAGALDADRLIAGSLTLLERTALLTVRFIDAKKGRTLSRTTATLLEPTQAELVDATRRLAHEAVTGQKLDTTGTIRINVSRTGADVTLDGRSLGDSPVSGVQRVLEGPHSVTVQKPGYIRWSTTLAVAAGQDVKVDAELIPLQLIGEAARSRLWTWGWVSTGVAVASATAGTVFGRMAVASHDDYAAATSRSAAVDLRDKTKFRTTLANVSWGLAGVSGVGAAALLTTAIVQDARAANDAAPIEPAKPMSTPAPPAAAPTAMIVPLPGGAMATFSFGF